MYLLEQKDGSILSILLSTFLVHESNGNGQWLRRQTQWGDQGGPLDPCGKNGLQPEQTKTLKQLQKKRREKSGCLFSRFIYLLYINLEK